MILSTGNCQIETGLDSIERIAEMRFTKIETFDNFLEYVNKTGIYQLKGTPGYIPQWQGLACDLIKKVEKLYNNTGKLENYPYYNTSMNVHFVRPKKDNYGYYEKGYLLVKTVNNEVKKVEIY